VEEGVLSAADLEVLLLRQAEYTEDTRPTIGVLAIEAGHIDQARLLSILDRHGSRLHLGELLMLRRFLAPSVVGRALRAQRAGEPLGETLLRLQLIEPSALAEALAEQSGIACIPIQQIPPDPTLARFLNPAYALQHGIAPVARRGQTLVVALWEPESLAAVEELERSAGLLCLPVLTTKREVEDRLRAVYLDAEIDDTSVQAA